MSQFHVKLFWVLLKCNTLIKLWRVWKIGKLVFFSVSVLFPLLLPSKWKGSGIWQHICNKKVHFTSKKLPLTVIQCEPRQRVNHKAYQYPAVFGEKQEVSDQLPLRKVPSVYARPGGRHSDFVLFFTFPFLFLTF